MEEFNSEQSYKELRTFGETLDTRIQDLENTRTTNDPIIDLPTKTEEFVPTHDVMKIDKLYAGLPVLTTIPTYQSEEGQIVLVKQGTTPNEIYDIYSYITNNASPAVIGWKKISSTTANSATFSHNAASTTTTVIAHGLGKAPSMVNFSWLGLEAGAPNLVSGGNGTYSALGQSCIHYFQNVYAIYATDSYALEFGIQGGANQVGTVSVDATNITITWTGTLSITFNVHWNAIG